MGNKVLDGKTEMDIQYLFKILDNVHFGLKQLTKSLFKKKKRSCLSVEDKSEKDEA